MAACGQGVGDVNSPAQSQPQGSAPQSVSTPDSDSSPDSSGPAQKPETPTTTASPLPDANSTSNSNTSGTTEPTPVPSNLEPAPRFFTEATPSGSYLFAVGDSATLQLAPDAPEPEPSGEAVVIIAMSSLAPTGNKQWELRAVANGETTITIDTSEGCRTWTLVVED